MVGKIKHVRQKLHQEAVKVDRPESLIQPSTAGLPHTLLKPPAPELRRKTTPEQNILTHDAEGGKQVLVPSALPSTIFAGTKISPEALVQTLKFEEPAHVALPTKKSPEEKKIKSKKEKMRERREKWLNKISFIKKVKEQQEAEAWRQATPVVGDMRPLADALPELCQLIGPAAAPVTSCRKSRKNKAPVKRPQPTDFSQMKGSQKRKLLETESSWFSDAVKMLSSRKNPLVDIGEQLRKRMRQEEEQGSG
ncbi:protein FAM207A [Kryptolebias marmoratus]|uniref:SLX9 ribosome biogenesis factor n=1 Tax=Kryptolebias marmoratus TaxID=37003 RepID=A0A3Q3AR08_KRYMA|nr:protein FAM207A [Kryptolebias marmoratus]